MERLSPLLEPVRTCDRQRSPASVRWRSPRLQRQPADWKRQSHRRGEEETHDADRNRVCSRATSKCEVGRKRRHGIESEVEDEGRAPHEPEMLIGCPAALDEFVREQGHDEEQAPGIPSELVSEVRHGDLQRENTGESGEEHEVGAGG